MVSSMIACSGEAGSSSTCRLKIHTPASTAASSQPRLPTALARAPVSGSSGLPIDTSLYSQAIECDGLCNSASSCEASLLAAPATSLFYEPEEGDECGNGDND